MSYEKLVKAAAGKIPFDLLIENTQLVNVYTSEIYQAAIGILGDRIAYIGEGPRRLKSKRRFNARGKYAIPGLVDSHLHIESSMVTPPRFAEAVLPHGTTTVAIDPHEVANVLGMEGVKMMLDSSRDLPLKVHALVPTCVPSILGVETAGAEFKADDVAEMLSWDRVIGLGEVMDYQGVIDLKDRITRIVKTGRKFGKILDGHAGLISRRALNAYIAAGMDSDHENFNFTSVLEKLRLGMAVKLRKMLLSRDFIAKLRKIPNLRNVMFCTDDVMPDDLIENGHLDDVVRTAVECGFDPVEAVKSSTLKPAMSLRLYDRGAIGPGKIADVILLRSLERFIPDVVFANGEMVAKEGKLLTELKIQKFPREAERTVKISRISVNDFSIKPPIQDGKVKVRVIALEGLASRFLIEEHYVKNGVLKTEGLAIVAVLERHGRSGSRTVGYVKNSGLRRGAVGSTVAHDSHNLIVLGMRPEDMLFAARALIRMQGGLVAVQNGQLFASVHLPIAGLMSNMRIDVVSSALRSFRRAENQLGVRETGSTLMITFLSLPVIPSAKITDRGLFDVDNQKFVSLFL